MTARSRRRAPSRLAIAVAPVLVVAVLGGAVWRRSMSSSERPLPTHVCGDLEVVRATSAAGGSPTPTSGSEGTPSAPGDTVEIVAVDAGSTWRFRHDATRAYRQQILEGYYEPGRAIDLTRTAVKEAIRSHGPRTRQVIVGSRVWVEDARLPERYECDALNGRIVPFDQLRVDLTPGQEPTETQSIGPSETTTGRRTGETVQEGDHVTTYRVTPKPGYEHMQIDIAVDDQRHLRAVDVINTRTGERTQTYRNDPAPDHRIADPTGEPIIDAGR
jgi:hypothetical protein